MMSGLNPEILFKCRLIVGRYGEMDIARWWNTTGILSTLGSKVASRGLPRTEFYGRARVLFAVASQRTREYFSPPQCFTLWSLPPSVENTLDEAVIRWAHEGRSWPVIENAHAGLKLGGIDQALQSVDIAPAQIRSSVAKLKAGPEGKSIRLAEISRITDETVALLAAAFSRSKPVALILPVVPVKGGDQQ
jgi:hypothetical protein